MKSRRLWLLSLLFVLLLSFSSLSAEHNKWIELPQNIPGFMNQGSTSVERLWIVGYERYRLEDVVWSSSDDNILEIIETTDESVRILAKNPGTAKITVDFDFYYMDEETATSSDATSSNAVPVTADMVMEMEHYTLSISYIVTGNEGDFIYLEDSDTVTIYRYRGESEHVIIPESINEKPVTGLFRYAFSNAHMKQITVPDKVREISFYAFYECPNLEIINLPADLEWISEIAIYGCPSLTKVVNDSSLDIDLIHFADTLDNGENTTWYSHPTGGVLLDGVLPAKSTMYRRTAEEPVKRRSSGGGGNIVTAPQSYAAKVNAGEIITAGSHLTAGEWRIEGDARRYLDQEGKIIKNMWIFNRAKWYLTDESGLMVTGWQRADGKWYLFAADGSMLINWQYVNDWWYFMDQSGALLTGTITPDGYQVNADGVWVG